MALETWELKGLEVSWQNLSKEELNREMSRYAMEWNTEKVQALLDFMKSKDNPDEAGNYHANFKDKYKEFKNDIGKKNRELGALKRSLKGKTGTEKDAIETKIQEKEKEINDAWKNFFKADMDDYVDTVGTKIDATEKAKDDEINRLKWELSWIVSHGPSLSEYFSIERRRLVTLNDGIMKLEQDKENYPKNVLIYLMGLSNSKIIWIRGVKNGLKRTWMKIAWKWNSDDIKENLQNFEESIKIKPDDSQWTMWLKKQLQEHLHNAKQAYVDQQKKSVWF